MDTGEGYFEQVTEEAPMEEFEDNLRKLEEALQEKYPNHGGIFYEGEELVIKGSRFRVAKIIRNGLKLELLPKE